MKILSPSWWVSTLISTLVTMAFIYIIKIGAAKFNIPVVSDVAAAV